MVKLAILVVNVEKEDKNSQDSLIVNKTITEWEMIDMMIEIIDMREENIAETEKENIHLIDLITNQEKDHMDLPARSWPFCSYSRLVNQRYRYYFSTNVQRTVGGLSMFHKNPILKT